MIWTLFWHQNELVTLDVILISADFRDTSLHKYAHCPCADLSHTSPAMRYGVWKPEIGLRQRDYYWHAHPLENFPKEFQALALLIG